ncbi:unnamed protein product [Nippostrongylus brasiliensis]|uniref:Secreted protein n=1 Tax=Nippostrongylus brasiliensis TaxID=27835 RepID=A0A0N4YGU7_NIPBR|nr:unnamed protein product [Nippostrongylus brasiliensis]
MQLILPLIVFIWYLPPAHSQRKKREDRVPWQTVVELQRIFREGNKRALDIETFTKQAAIRQNEVAEIKEGPGLSFIKNIQK